MFHGDNGAGTIAAKTQAQYWLLPREAVLHPHESRGASSLRAAGRPPAGAILSSQAERLPPYSAGTIEGARAAALSSLRRSAARRIFAIIFRNARVSRLGFRKWEANSLLISSGRQ